MDNKNTILDFKLLVEQFLKLLDGLTAVSQCDAIQLLLQSLKCKYPEASDQIVKNLFPHIVDNCAVAAKSDSKKQLSILQSTKKEEIKTEDEGSTDLNQNFEKILCKEEFMCLDEDDDDDGDGDGDDEDPDADEADTENASSLNKRLHYSRSASNQDPLDLIPSSIIDTNRQVNTQYVNEALDNNIVALVEEQSEVSNGFNACDVDRTLRRPTFQRNNHTYNNTRLVSEKLVLCTRSTEVSTLGKGYVFHPDSEVTIHYHHSTGEFSVRAFKEQFRFRLKVAMNEHHKPFLKQFYKNFILSGQLLGTKPPAHVLQAIRAQRQEEWQSRLQRMLTIAAQSKRLQIPAAITESEMDSESESQLSSTAQEIMKFEEFIDDGEGAGRLIDGMEMEPEIEEVLGSVSSNSGGEATDLLPRIPSPESVSTLASLIGGDTGTSSSISSINNHTQRNLHQHGNNLVINGLTTSNNNSNINISNQQLANIAEHLPTAPKEHLIQHEQPEHQQFHSISPHQQQQLLQQQLSQQQQQQQQHPHMFAIQNMQHNLPHENNVKSECAPDMLSNSSDNMLKVDATSKLQIVNNNNINNMNPQHFQTQHQRVMAAQQQQHFNSNLHENNPLSLVDEIMEQHCEDQSQSHVEQNPAVSLINSIDGLLEDSDTNAAQQEQLHSQQISLQQHMPNQLIQHQNLQQHMLLQSNVQTATAQQIAVPSLSNASSMSGTIPNSAASISQHSASLDMDENDLSHDDDDDENENDIDDMEAKQQLIDGGSSSSTSLQAPPGTAGGSSNQSGTGGGMKKAKPSYDCLLCPKSYRKRKSLLDHYKMHPGYCHDCGKPNGTSLEEIIHHNRTMHSKEFPFVCDTCGESYSRRQQFHAHVESHNKKEFKTYSCVECGQKFSHKKLHQQHLEDTGHKVDGAICEVCGAEFPSKNALYQHIIRVHKKDNFFECHICQNRFTLKANLERHVQLHTEIKRTYVCDLCGSSYFTYPALKDHYSNAHTDASECKCTLCGKRFGSAKSLQRHLPSHSEERPHCCCYCDQTFKWKTHLVRHKQTVHGNQPSPKKVKRFSKVDEELIPVPDIPGPPPAKVAKKSNASKPKQQPPLQSQQQQQLQQHKSGPISTPPPLSTTPGTSQEQFNAAMISNNSSQSSTASTSQHSLSASESQQNSMYSHSFSAEKLLGQQQPQAQTPHHSQQQQQQQQQQQLPTPPPPTQQQQHHRHTPSNSNTSEGNLMTRLSSFSGSAANENQFHFEQNVPSATAASSYQQHAMLNQYQQQHHHQQQQQQQQQQQANSTSSQQQQHLRSHTPQSPHQHPQQLQQQHFTSPHHISAAPQQMSHHHQQLLHQHQLQQHRHSQQRSPHHHHPTPTQQLQQHQQASHSPQHARLQSPQPVQVHAPQTPQQTTQQQQYQQQCASLQQTSDAWGNIGFGTSGPSNNTSQQQTANAANNATDIKDNSNKFYIVDSAEFLGIPLNVGSSTSTSSSATSGVTPQSQQQQQQQATSVSSKQQQQQQQDASLTGDLLGFQSMWPQNTQAAQMPFGSAAQQQQVGANPNQSTGAGASDPHNYSNIGSILTNLIDSNPNPMEYNFDLMQPTAVSQSQQQQNALTSHHQQHHPGGVSYGLQPAAGASGLMRHAGMYGSSIYDNHPTAHHASLNDISEQQKNSFQPYHPHSMQSHAGTANPHPLTPTAHHPLAGAAHLLPPPPTHASLYERSGYPVLGDEPKTVLPPISDYMHHMQQQQQLAHTQQQDLVYYPVKND